MAGDQHSANLRNTTGPYMLVPSLHVVGAIQEEFGPIRGITQLDDGLVVRHVEVVRSFLQGFLNLATKYAKIVSDDVVTPILKAHIVQTLFLQKTGYGSRVGMLVLPAKRDYTTTKMDG